MGPVFSVLETPPKAEEEVILVSTGLSENDDVVAVVLDEFTSRDSAPLRP